MNIKNLKQHIITGPEDGQTIAMIVDNTAYLIQTHGMSDAIFRMKREFGIQTHEWMLSCDKAVLIPGIWEYQMAVCIKGMNEDQVADLADQLKLNAEAA
jgi:hypothetical protein